MWLLPCACQAMCGLKVSSRCLGNGKVEVQLQIPTAWETRSKILGSFSGPLTLHVEVEGQAVSGTPLTCDPTKVQVDGSPVMWAYDSWQSRTVA